MDGLQAVKELETLGVKLVCVSEGWDARRNDSPMYMQFRFIIAEEEHRRIRERMEGGKLRAIHRDNAPPGGSLTFGYRMGKHGEYIIDPIERELVEYIFRLYLGGSPIAEIARELAQAGVGVGQKFQKRGSDVVTVRADHVGKTWTRNKVHAILKNSTYCGSRTWKGQTFPCPAIIDPTDFRRAQALLAVRARGTNKSDPDKCLLSGLFQCASCKQKFYRKCVANPRKGEHYEYYVCAGSQMKNAGDVYCQAKSVPVAWLDQNVWQMLEAYIREPETLIRKMVAADKGRTAQAGELAEVMEALRQEGEAIETQVATIWQEQAVNAWPMSWVTPRLNALASRQNIIAEKMKAMRGQLAAITFSREDSSQVLAEVARLRKALDAGLTRKQQFDFVRAVWQEGIITTTGQRWSKSAAIHFEFKWGELVITPSVGQHQCQTTEGVTPIRFDLQFGKTDVA